MALYFLPSIIFMTTYTEYANNKNLRKIILISIFFSLILMETFRSTSLDTFYGYDTNEYIKFYNAVLYNQSGFEIGYATLNLLLRSMTTDYRYLFFIMSFGTMFFLSKSIDYYTENKSIALLSYICIFLYIRDLSQMRASLAYSICIYSTIYLLENNKKKFLMYIILATSIHFSSILMLIIYPIYKFKPTKKQLYIILVISLLLFKLNLSWMNNFLDIVSTLPKNKFTTSFINYNNNINSRGLDNKVMLYLFISLFGVYIKDYNNIKSDKYDINIYMLVIGIFIAAIFNGSEIISVRLSELFITSMIIVISKFKDITNYKYLEILYHYLTCLFLIIYNIFFILSLSKYGL